MDGVDDDGEQTSTGGDEAAVAVDDATTNKHLHATTNKHLP